MSWRIEPVKLGLVSVAVGSVVALVLVGSIWILPGLESQNSNSASFTLNDTQQSVSMSFTNCTKVNVVWTIHSGGPGSFGIWPPPDLVHSNCPNQGASNATPPNGYRTYGSEPTCYESGAQGECWFYSTQQEYTFFLFGPWNGTAWLPVGDEVATVTVTW